MELTVGQVYKRTDIHDYFGGQRQGGISTPSDHPVILLFPGGTGEQYGYRDGFQEDGTFWYTGEGQIGDMEFVRGNKALLGTRSNGKTVHLFEHARKAYVRIIGELTYVGHHDAFAPDANGQQRRVIVFELALIGERGNTESADEPEMAPPVDKLWQIPIAEVHAAALSTTPAKTALQKQRNNTYLRSEAVRVYVLRRAAGTCEGCGEPAPFSNRQGRPYLEPHHIHRLSDGGPDHPAHVAALCPNCHRRVHYGQDGEAYNVDTASRIWTRERSLS